MEAREHQLGLGEEGPKSDLAHPAVPLAGRCGSAQCRGPQDCRRGNRQGYIACMGMEGACMGMEDGPRIAGRWGLNKKKDEGAELFCSSFSDPEKSCSLRQAQTNTRPYFSAEPLKKP